MVKPMNIAMMVRSFIPLPRPNDIIYAPIDLAIQIAKGLGKRGHHVTLYAPLGSEVYGENISIESLNLRPLVTDQQSFTDFLNDTEHLANGLPGLWDRYMSTDMYRRASKGEFDILHFQHVESALSTAVLFPSVPTIYTLNDPIYGWRRELLQLYASANQRFISISNNQRNDAPDLPYQATVYNGTDVDLFTFSDEPEDYLLYVGRITPQKGVREAIKVARDTKRRLLIIGPINHGDELYFEQYVKPELDDQILYLGHLDQDQLPKYYQKAAAVLTPVQWEEPFGLTTIEAMACGAPVISLRRGAAPELIEDGKTGFVVHSLAEMVESVGKLDMIDRHACREHVKKHFSIDMMVDGYEAAYADMIAATRTAKAK